jgi:hypothetical protein
MAFTAGNDLASNNGYQIVKPTRGTKPVSENQADKGNLDAAGTADEASSIAPGTPDTAAAANKSDAEPAKSAAGDSSAPTGSSYLPATIVPIRSAGGGAYGHDREHVEHEAAGAAPSSRTGKFAAIAAIVAVAAVVGAFGGSLATAGLGHVFAAKETGKSTLVAENHALKESVAKLDADLAALKASVERTGKSRTAQLSKVGERLDKVEKAQDETGGKLIKLGEAQDKLRVATATPPAAPKETKETTASIPAPAPKPEAAKLPVLSGWILRDVADGGATIEGRTGIYEVFPGDPLPGLNRVQAVRKVDGRWAVVTAKGLIVAR